MIVVAIIAIFSATDTANAYTLGQTGPEIANLQISLIESGYDIPLITSGAARPGYFGTQTQAALAKRDAGGIIFGANAGQDSYFPYVGNNNVQRWTYRSSFRNGTTTPCAYRNTAGATTTIDFASVLINTGTSTATVWTIATSTTPYATTTLLTSQSLQLLNRVTLYIVVQLEVFIWLPVHTLYGE